MIEEVRRELSRSISMGERGGNLFAGGLRSPSAREPLEMSVISLFKDCSLRRHHGQCQRCERVDYLPWATERGVRYCGQCWENDAISYVFGMKGARVDES